MEKIKLSNSQELSLVSMGISEQSGMRYFTVKSDLTVNELKANFSNVNDIQYILEDGSVCTTYTDCIELRTVTENIKDGTYTVGIYFNASEKKIAKLQAQINVLTATGNTN